jgi:hypothetical protein
MDCNVEREIKVQDAFQVKRCVECQKKYRAQKRTKKMEVKTGKVKVVVPLIPEIIQPVSQPVEIAVNGEK